MSRLETMRSGPAGPPSPWGRRAAPESLRWPLLTAAVAAAAAVIVLAVSFAGESSGRSVDLWFVKALSGTVTTRAGHDLSWMIGSAGDPIPAAVLILLLVSGCLLLGRWRLALVSLTAQVVIGIVTTLLKHVVGRRIHDGSLSFPSGHTAQLTGLAMVAGLFIVERARMAGLGAALVVLASGALGGIAMAWSQISNQVHYATDTLGGFCVAAALVCLAILTVDGLGDGCPHGQPTRRRPTP